MSEVTLLRFPLCFCSASAGEVMPSIGAPKRSYGSVCNGPLNETGQSLNWCFEHAAKQRVVSNIAQSSVTGGSDRPECELR